LWLWLCHCCQPILIRSSARYSSLAEIEKSVMTAKALSRFWRNIVAVALLLYGAHLAMFHHHLAQYELPMSSPGSSPRILPSSIAQEPPGPEEPSRQYNFTVAVCVIVKDGEAYLQEWLDYHLVVLEFQNIYVYDNSDHFDLAAWYSNTRGHPLYRRVEVVHHPGQEYIEEKEDYAQSVIVADCVHRFGNNGPRHDYIAHFDIDEFMVPQQPQRYPTIRSILQDYLVPFGGALTINWMFVGTSNRTLYAPLPVTKRFQYRNAQPHASVKTIFSSKDFQSLRNPHAVNLRHPAETHTTLYPGCLFNASSKTKASDQKKPSSIFLLYHYRYLSIKEYLEKRCRRGNLSIKFIWCKNGKLRSDTPTHIQPSAGEVYDDTAWKLLTKYVPQYKAFEQFQDFS